MIARLVLGEREETCNAMSAYVDDAPAADGRIVELAKQTTSRLEVLWDEVGYTSEEKRRQMQGLVDGFQTLCENKVRLSLPTRSSTIVVSWTSATHSCMYSSSSSREPHRTVMPCQPVTLWRDAPISAS